MLNEIAFLLCAALTLAGAVAAMMLRNLVHCALCAAGALPDWRRSTCSLTRNSSASPSFWFMSAHCHFDCLHGPADPRR
jgi:hypothetical protein